MLESKIACHTFISFSQPRPIQNWLIAMGDISKELGFIFVILKTVPLYIKWDEFIIVQVTLIILYNWDCLKVMLVLNNYV